MRRYLLLFNDDPDIGMEVFGPFASESLARLELGGHVDEGGDAVEHPRGLYLDINGEAAPTITRIDETERYRAWEDFHIEAQAALADEIHDRYRDTGV